MKISLFNLTQTVLIVPSNTGIVYSNQVGGTQCDQKEIEGFIIPIEYDFLLEEPENSLTLKLCRLFPEGNPGVIDKPEAEAVQLLLNASSLTNSIEIDWDKLSNSKESWVYVIIKGDLDGEIEAGEVKEAVLTWPNSD